MIAEAIKSVETLARQAANINRPTFVDMRPYGEPPGTYAVVNADGSFDLRSAERMPRSSTISTLDDLVSFVQYASETLQQAPVIYFTESQAEALLNDAEVKPAERAITKLEFTEAFNAIRDRDAYDQRELVNLLRTTLYDCFDVGTVEALIRQLRTLQFATSATGRADIQHGRDALGKEVREQVTGDGNLDLPERLTLSVKVFTDPSLETRVNIRCALDVNVREQRFRLLPLGDDLDVAVTKSLQAIASLLGTANVPVFQGAP